MPSTAWSDLLNFCKVAGIVIISALGVSWALALYNECDRGDHGDQQELRPFYISKFFAEFKPVEVRQSPLTPDA
jgi:hypothetical protein